MEEEDEDDQLIADGGQVRHRRELVEFPGYQTWCWGQLTLETVLPPGQCRRRGDLCC